MPVGRALGVYTNSSYPGVRAEMQPYHRAIATDRYQVWEPLWLTPLYAAWLREFLTTNEWQEFRQELTAGGLVDFDALDLHETEWNWPEKELVVDPSREETARKSRMSMGLSDREREMDSVDLEERDKRAAHMLGIDDVQVYRRMIAQSIHGVPVPDAQPAAGAPGENPAEFGNLGRRQWQNNRKAIRDVLGEVISGEITEAAALQMLQSLGLPEARAQAFIDDARDSTIDDPELVDADADPPPANQPAGPAIAAGWPITANCGTGDGGFQPGNDCGGKGSGGGSSGPAHEATLLADQGFQNRVNALDAGKLVNDDGTPIARDPRISSVEQAAIVDYSDGGADTLNAALRGPQAGNLSALEQAEVEAIDGALAKLPPSAGSSWRGQDRSYLDHLQPGTEYEERGFLSTSASQNHPSLQKGSGRAIIEVVGKTGRDISHTSMFPGESEVLLPRNTTFRVTARHEDADGTLRLTFEE
jgi:hypothetical protein